MVESQNVDLDVAGSIPVIHPFSAARTVGCSDRCRKQLRAFVAQLDRATDFESVGRRFDSCRTHVFVYDQGR